MLNLSSGEFFKIKTMNDLKPLNIDFIEQLWGQGQASSEDQKLLNWAAKTQFIDRIEVSKWRFGDSLIYRANARTSASERPIVGTGRDQNKEKSICKAISEVIERFVMTEVYSKPNPLSIESNFQSFENLKIQAATSPYLVEFDEFKTSSGWAAHSDFKESLRNSILEAFERHILLLTYFRYGWAGFHISDSVHWNGFSIESAISRVKISNFSAGICLGSKNPFPGIFLGYLVDESSKIEQSRKWVDALWEMYDAFDAVTFNEKIHGKAQYSDSSIGQYGNFWLQTQKSTFSSDDPSPLLAQNSSRFYLQAFDVSRALNMDFPYYVTFSGFGDLIPLFFDTKNNPALKEFLRLKIPGFLCQTNEQRIWHPAL